MIVAAAVCPHPPLLFREVTGTLDVAADLRAACLSVISAVTEGPVDRVIVVGGADASQLWDVDLDPEVRGFLAAVPTPSGLPLSLGIGKWLLNEACWRGALTLSSVAWDASADAVADMARDVVEIPGRNALLVMGDGSACRGDKAPGYLDERALGYDAETAHALATGDFELLQRQDAALAAQLLVAGRAAFAVLAEVAARGGHGAHAPQAELVYQDDPYGVMYYVARWAL